MHLLVMSEEGFGVLGLLVENDEFGGHRNSRDYVGRSCDRDAAGHAGRQPRDHRAAWSLRRRRFCWLAPALRLPPKVPLKARRNSSARSSLSKRALMVMTPPFSSASVSKCASGRSLRSSHSRIAPRTSAKLARTTRTSATRIANLLWERRFHRRFPRERCRRSFIRDVQGGLHREDQRHRPLRGIH